MSVIFDLPHEIKDRTGWLWYSHHPTNPPSDRQVVRGNSIVSPPSVRLAPWYFLSDAALQMLGADHLLFPVCYGHWQLEIDDAGRAALFKLRFM